MQHALRSAACIVAVVACAWTSAAEPFKAATKVKVSKGAWEINGKPTFAGSTAEGLLANVRMANALFEDRNPKTCPKDFDPEKNTDAFIAKIPDYKASGIIAFGLNLQGAPPGYDGALCSAFEPDGSLRPDFLKRAARAIEACDKAGAVVILGLFDASQDQVLKDDEAVRKAITFAAAWVREKGYTNVLLEIASDFIAKGYDREVIKNPTSMRDLVALAKKTAPDLLVSTSGGGGGRIDRRIATASDFLLLHFNIVLPEAIAQKAAAASKVAKAIICNEDPKTGEEGVKALQASSDAFISWGYSNVKKNQTYPFKFEGPADDPLVYAKFKELATPSK